MMEGCLEKTERPERMEREGGSHNRSLGQSVQTGRSVRFVAWQARRFSYALWALTSVKQSRPQCSSSGSLVQPYAPSLMQTGMAWGHGWEHGEKTGSLCSQAQSCSSWKFYLRRAFGLCSALLHSPSRNYSSRVLSTAFKVNQDFKPVHQPSFLGFQFKITLQNGSQSPPQHGYANRRRISQIPLHHPQTA